MTTPIDPIAVAILLAGRLDALGIVHTIGGSIASSFAGEPRSTADVDFVVAIEEKHVPDLMAALSTDFYVEETALRRAVRDRARTNLIHQGTQIKVDRDILAIIRVQGPRLEQEYLETNAAILNVGQVLERALREGKETL